MTSRSRLALVFLGLVLTGAQAEAQDTLRVAPAPAPSRTHVVQAGETLWALAERYLGDALLWPAIYRLNTVVVEDPHWIYPGEQLDLGAGAMEPAPTVAVAEPAGAPADTSAAPAPADTVVAQAATPVTASDSAQMVERPSVAAAELPPPPPPLGEAGSTVFTRKASRAPIFSGTAGTRLTSGVLPGQFYGAGFLTENDRLPWAEVLGAAGKATLGNLTTISSARIFEAVEIRAPEGSSYHIGDSLLVAVLGREIPKWGRVVTPTGIVRVREVSNRRVVADVLSQWSRIGSDQVAMPLEPFRSQGSAAPVPIENGLTGKVIASRDVGDLPGQQAVVFIDRGREDGVSLGDVFEVLRPNPPEASPETPLQQIAVVQIVHVRQRSASGVVTNLADLGLGANAPVRLIRKMSS